VHKQLDFLKSEAAKGQRGDFERYLSLVPDVAAISGSDFKIGM
jgi:hypothetical protein